MIRPKKTVFVIIAWAMSACFWAVAGDESVAELIKKLGHEDREVYKAAKKALLAKGYSAYRELSKVKTDDPEVRKTVDDIMKAVRYSVIPGLETEVRQLYGEFDENRTGEAVWEVIASKAPERVMDLIVDLGRDEKHVSNLHHGVKAFLRYVRPYPAAAYLAKFPEDDRKGFVRLLDRMNAEFYAFKYEQTMLFLCMKDYKRAVSRCAEIWKSEGDPAAVEIAASAIGMSREPKAFWAMAGRRIVNASTPAVKCTETAFFCGVANALNKPHVLKGIYTLAEVQGAPPDPAVKLYDVLKMNGDKALIDDFLNAAQGPVLKYLLLKGFYREAGEPLPKDELKTIIADVGGEESLIRLAVRMLGIDRDDASAVLEAILAKEPFGSLFDAESNRILAMIAMDEGRIRDAAKRYSSMMSLRSEGAVKHPWGESHRLLISELEAHAKLQDAECSKLLKSGLAAEFSGDSATAEKAFREAIKRQKALPAAYKMLIWMLRKQNRFHDAAAVTKQLIAQKPLTTRDCRAWCAYAVEVGDMDAAKKWLEQYQKKEPDKTEIAYLESLIAERAGDFAKAAVRLQELVAKGGERQNVLRRLGTLSIKQRKLEDAERALMSHVLYNPFDHYGRATLFIARGLAGKDDASGVEDYLKDMNCSDDDWPTWLLKYLAGKVSESDLLKKAQSMGTEADRVGQLCEARFTVGMQSLIKGDKKKARLYFQKTVDMGITLYIEHYWAQDELKRMDEK